MHHRYFTEYKYFNGFHTLHGVDNPSYFPYTKVNRLQISHLYRRIRLAVTCGFPIPTPATFHRRKHVHRTYQLFLTLQFYIYIYIWSDKVREVHIRGIVHYEFVPTGQSTKFTIWKYWKGCVKMLDGNDPNILPITHVSCITTMHLLTWQCLWESF